MKFELWVLARKTTFPVLLKSGCLEKLGSGLSISQQRKTPLAVSATRQPFQSELLFMCFLWATWLLVWQYLFPVVPGVQLTEDIS